MQLQETVQIELNAMVESGTINQIIRTQLTKTVTDIISESMRSYSDFGKRLNLQVSKALDIDLSKMEIIDYLTVVSKIVKEQLDGTLYETAVKPITEQIKGYTGFLSKAEYKLSELVQLYIVNVMEESNDHSGEISLCVEESDYGGFYVGFDDDRKTVTFSKCEHKLYIDKHGEVYSFTAGKYRGFRGDIRRENRFYRNFDALLFKLYAQKVKIVIDTEDCEREWYRD